MSTAETKPWFIHIQFHEATLQIVIIPYLNFTPKKKTAEVDLSDPK